jgi:hypothetical protein
MMEPLMEQHVLPELSSNHPFLKQRACWLYGEFSSFNFTNQQHLRIAIDGIYKACFAEELPVRLSACIAMADLLKNKVVRDFLKPALGKVIEIYLKTISEIDSERLISSFENIMSRFRNDIGPYAL